MENQEEKFSGKDFRKMTNPLLNPAFKEPGFLKKLAEVFFPQKRPLSMIQIEVTSHCMGRCFYCPHTTFAKSWKSRHMSFETMAALWPLLEKSGRAHLQGWGEPLLHPHFFEMAQFAAKAGCKISTTTCGLIMSEEIAEKIISSGMEVVAFSLTGTTPESNGAREGVNFSKVIGNIRILKKAIEKNGYGPQINIAYLLLADNMETVLNLPELMAESGADSAIISTLDFLSMPEHAQYAILPHEDEKIKKAAELLERAREKARIMGKSLIYALPGDQPAPNGCREEVQDNLYVDAFGRISPCVYLNPPYAQSPGLNFGSVLDENPWEIWQKGEYCEFRESLRNNIPPEWCIRCPKRMEGDLIF